MKRNQNQRKEKEKLKKQGFILSSAILIGTVFITKILGLIYKIPLTNILGGTGTGYYSCAYAVFMPMFAISVSGVPAAMSRMISENAAFERWKNVRKIRRVSRIFFLGVGFCFTFLTLALAYPLCRYVIKEPAALWSVIAIAPCILIGAVMAVERGYYEGLRNMTPTAISEIIEGVFKIIFGLGFAYKALVYTKSSFERTGAVFGIVCSTAEEVRLASLPYVAAASVLGVTAANAVSCLWIIITYKIKGDGITQNMLRKDESTDRMRFLLKKLICLAIPIAVASVITTLTSMVDLITINRCLSFAINKNEELFFRKFGLIVSAQTTKEMLPNFIYGSYTGLAMTVFGLIPSFTSMFGKSILPAVSEEWSKGNKVAVSKHINAVLFITGLIAIPSGIGISVFSENILRLLFPGKNAEIIASYESLEIMCAGMIFLALSVPIFSILQAIGKPKIPVRIMLFACIIKMVMNILLVSVPEINILGAGIATTACYTIIFLCSLWELLRLTGIKIDYVKLFAKPFFASVLCGAAAKLSYNFLYNRIISPLDLFISILFGVIIYIFALYLLSVLTKNELKTIFFK